MQEPPTPTLLRPPVQAPDAPPEEGPPAPPPITPRLKKLRLGLILLGLTILALISTVFGMMMAVASDLPALENQTEYRSAKNSVLLADDGRHTQIAKLTGNQNRILLSESEISPDIKNAVIAVEDRRFYQHEGVDYKGIGRALWQDLRRRRTGQGGSTITQQFVKNALSAQGDRSVFQKLREAALAYHLERQWSKPKILTQYLNTVYFGNGAYGVESAARTYFGGAEAGDVPAASDVTPAQAALLAGMISSPTAYDPIQNPGRAKERRDLVLEGMLDQRLLTRSEYEDAIDDGIPAEDDIKPPRPASELPYFSTWLTQELVDRYGAGLVFGGGLRIRTTIDPELQAAAEQAITRRLGALGPDASLVAIENKTGEVKAMVGGDDFARKPFNLATNGHRQPGSAFKPFTLIAALEDGVSPDATFTSQKKALPVPGGSPTDRFIVNNYEDRYAGLASVRSATASSDNSVFAELGLKVGTRKIARLARRMGIRTPLSTNPAMTLGGLEEGLTPLELAYAYTAIANKGMRVSGTLAPAHRGPVAIEAVDGDGRDARNEKRSKRVFPPAVGETAQQLLAGVIQGGTGKAAQIGEFAAGKTGTTENYGDAWFVGFNNELTVAVWVGYADQLRPMETEYRGGPVAGGTFPAEIWRDFMTAWMRIREERDAAHAKDEGEVPLVPTVPATPVPSQQQKTAPQAPKDEDRSAEGKDGGQPAPERPPPQQRKPAQPTPQPPPQPSPGGESGGAVGAPGQ
jgi:penicillin-binding protein 1A